MSLCIENYKLSNSVMLKIWWEFIIILYSYFIQELRKKYIISILSITGVL